MSAGAGAESPASWADSVRGGDRRALARTITWLESTRPDQAALGQAILEELRGQGAASVVVVVGGIIPPHDYEFLREKGVAAIFGPGTAVPVAAREVLRVIRERHG